MDLDEFNEMLVDRLMQLSKAELIDLLGESTQAWDWLSDKFRDDIEYQQEMEQAMLEGYELDDR